METVLLTEKEFKENITGFVFTMKCHDPKNRKFAVEGLQPGGSY